MVLSPLTEVHYWNDDFLFVFFKPVAVPGPQRNFEDLCEALQIPPWASLSVSLLKMFPSHSIRKSARAITPARVVLEKGAAIAREGRHIDLAVGNFNKQMRTPHGTGKRSGKSCTVKCTKTKMKVKYWVSLKSFSNSRCGLTLGKHCHLKVNQKSAQRQQIRSPPSHTCRLKNH